jgi:hypothetical protein
MHRPDGMGALPRGARVMLASVLLCCMLTASLSACGSNAQMQEQVGQRQEQLTKLLQHARTIGVPPSLLNPITKQEQELQNTRAPFTLFNDQPVIDYYRNLTTRYGQLYVQLQGVIASSTEQSRSQTQRDMQNFQVTLTQRRANGLPVQVFTQQFEHYQSKLPKAQYPKEYAEISRDAKKAVQALHLLQTTTDQLGILKQTIDQMKKARLNIAALQTQYESDQQALTRAHQAQEFQQLGRLIEAHYQQAVVNTTQALPYITVAKLSELEAKVKQIKTFGEDASPYQKRLDAARVQMQKTKTVEDYIRFARLIDSEVTAMRADLIKAEARYLVRKFHQEVDTWGRSHLFHNKYDNQDYPLNSGYMQQGIGSDLDLALSWAVTLEDYQTMIDEANSALFNLHMLMEDYQDRTPYDKVHTADTKILQHYKLQKGQVLIVSLVGQAMRIYQDGKLVRAFLVTTGRTELPSIPGVWSVLNRESPTKFKSSAPKNSPYWFPDTPIHYAILYRHGGYFVHDSWWRADYGPGTQFPHIDSGGDQDFSGNGSHGCVNLREDLAAWLYQNTDWNTKIVIY